MRRDVASPPARRVIAATLAESPNATWSNCLVVGDEVAMSGVTARGSDGAPIGGASLKAQTLAVFERVVALLKAAGGGAENIYKLVIYVTDIARKDEVNAARAAFFKPAYPCSTLLEVKGFAFADLLVEVDVFANLTVDRHALAPGTAP